jgi:hypothetical protein
MYKLLPEEEKVLIKSEYKNRRLVVIAWFILGMLLVGVVALFPSYVITVYKETDARDRMAQLNKELSANSETDSTNWLANINTKIKLFSPSLDKDKPYEAFVKIISLKSSGIILTGISFTKGTAGKDKYTVSGTAGDRRSLIAFQNSLNTSSEFENASVPVSDLAQDKNISFKMDLDVKK